MGNDSKEYMLPDASEFIQPIKGRKKERATTKEEAGAKAAHTSYLEIEKLVKEGVLEEKYWIQWTCAIGKSVDASTRLAKLFIEYNIPVKGWVLQNICSSPKALRLITLFLWNKYKFGSLDEVLDIDKSKFKSVSTCEKVEEEEEEVRIEEEEPVVDESGRNWYEGVDDSRRMDRNKCYYKKGFIPKPLYDALMGVFRQEKLVKRGGIKTKDLVRMANNLNPKANAEPTRICQTLTTLVRKYKYVILCRPYEVLYIPPNTKLKYMGEVESLQSEKTVQPLVNFDEERKDKASTSYTATVSRYPSIPNTLFEGMREASIPSWEMVERLICTKSTKVYDKIYTDMSAKCAGCGIAEHPYLVYVGSMENGNSINRDKSKMYCTACLKAHMIEHKKDNSDLKGVVA